MRYKMTKNIKFVINTFVFFQLKMHQNPFPDPTGGAYDAPPNPDPLVGYSLPIPLPARRLRSASRTRRLRRVGSQAPLNTKSWLRQWSILSRIRQSCHCVSAFQEAGEHCIETRLNAFARSWFFNATAVAAQCHIQQTNFQSLATRHHQVRNV